MAYVWRSRYWRYWTVRQRFYSRWVFITHKYLTVQLSSITGSLNTPNQLPQWTAFYSNFAVPCASHETPPTGPRQADFSTQLKTALPSVYSLSLHCCANRLTGLVTKETKTISSRCWPHVTVTFPYAMRYGFRSARTLNSRERNLIKPLVNPPSRMTGKSGIVNAYSHTHYLMIQVLEMGRYMPVYHTGTSSCSWISYRHL
jgi:hypothetical protein